MQSSIMKSKILNLNPLSTDIFKKDKQSQLDIVCPLKGGEIVDIEIQLADEGNYKKRSL